jgi:hypothetical protein
MSAEAIARTFLCGLAFCGGLVMAADDEAPESDFLEYLGMWEETDEDWLMLEKTRIGNDEERSEDDGQGDDTPEKEDES